MSLRSLLITVCLVSAAAWAIAQEALPTGPAADPLANAPPTDARHYSYAIGLQIGTSFHDDEMEINTDSLIAGLKDGLAGAKPQYDEQTLAVAVHRMYQQQLEGARKKNEAYLAENAKAEGVVTLPSGLQYKVLATGSGPSPVATDTVRVNYIGRFINGDTFDESGETPAEFKVGGVIDGWTEALMRMKVGDKWQLVLPAKLAYGENGRDEIPPNSTLVFEVELVAIVGK